MKLIDGEQVVLQANEGILVLTTHRLRLTQELAGRRQVVSMTLDAVASCSVVMRSPPWLLVLAIVAAAAGALMLGTDVATGGGLLALAALFLLLWFLFRRTVLAVASAGESIFVGARGMSREALTGFIDALEATKLARAAPAQT